MPNRLTARFASRSRLAWASFLIVLFLIPACGGDSAVGGSSDDLQESPPAHEPDPSEIEASERLQATPVELGGAQPVEWVVQNTSPVPVAISKFESPTLSLFLLDPLPIELTAEAETVLHLVFVPHPNPNAGAGDDVEGAGILTLRTAGGDVFGEKAVTVQAELARPALLLDLVEFPLDGLPTRLAVWDRYVFVATADGRIDVFRAAGPADLALVERITVVAETPNHEKDGAPSPDTHGRLIGGLAVGTDGTVYVTHTDPRLNEGEFAQTGHLANLNSGMITALSGPPGSYGQLGHRRDLVTGLPRNVTNHIPLGLALQDQWLYVAVGSMTDSGVPDPSKPDADTALSGAILRLNLQAPPELFPMVLAEPGGAFGSDDGLVAGVLERWATGLRNGFGLTFDQLGNLWVTDQGSDGGAAPQPQGDAGPPGITGNNTPDHLHRVPRGAYLGQPNLARGEAVLNDGSAYDRPVPSPDYAPPVHVFGVHNSATGVVEYRADLFPALSGWLLVAKFSGAEGLQALQVEDGNVVAVRVLIPFEENRNITDITVGPDGEIILAEFWAGRLLIATEGSSAVPGP